jgi:hypothetical protein
MDKRIIYTRPDDGVSIVIPSGEISIGEVIEKDIPNDATNIFIINVADLPSDRAYRDAWKHDKGVISLNMERARVICMDKLRDERKPILESLDIDWMKAIGTKNETLADEIESKRQALRDMPITLSTNLADAKTQDDLKLITLELIK